MKVPSDVICGVCKKVFCCAECRYKHEIKTHAISVVVQKPKDNEQDVDDPSKAANNFETTNIYLFCSICERKPMPLQREMYAEMLAHVEEYHLPLRCRKCAKVYNRIDDLQNFTKCSHTTLPPSTSCYTHDGCYSDLACDTIAIQKEIGKVTISTQTSPQQRRIEQNNEFHQTPMSLINLRWKNKSKLTHEECVTDSVSSLKNISSISNGSGRRSMDAVVKPQGQLVRTTSTPVHAELLYTKHTERTFNASGGQVSSIHHSAGEPDNASPAGVAATSHAPPPCLSPNRQHLESVNRYLKVGGARAKMTAVTPLRQVMSKSIQKAFAEHGGLPSAMTMTRLTYGADTQPLSTKKLLEPLTTDACQASPARSPLDLRLSPAVRRTHHEIHTTQIQTTTSDAWSEPKSAITQNVRHEVLCSSQKLTTTKSIVITRTTSMTSIESATASSSSVSSDGLNSIASKFSDKSLASSTDNTSYNSAVSGSSAGSMYKSCQSIEIFTATTAVSDEQLGCYARSTDDYTENISGKIVPTMEAVSQLVNNNNLPPITPITRIPGALINKKLIRFDSPCEEDELELEKFAENNYNLPKINSASLETSNTHATMTPPPEHKATSAGSNTSSKVTETPLSTNSTKSKVKNKATATPINNSLVSKLKTQMAETPEATLNTNNSASETFFTPSGTPMRRKTKMRVEADSANKIKNAKAPRKAQENTTFERIESMPDSENENDEVFHHGTVPKHGGDQCTTTALGRSWSFGSILGAMIRLPSKSKGTPVEKVKTPSPHQSSSLIERCASLAGSLVRSQSLIDKEEDLRHQKRKRCYTTEGKLITNAPSEYSHYSDPLSPTTENSLRTKRFRVHGRRPIERMRRDI